MSNPLGIQFRNKITSHPAPDLTGHLLATAPVTYLPDSVPCEEGPASSVPSAALLYSHRMELIEQFGQSLSAGWDLERILRLALRMALTGAPPRSGACVMWLDSARNSLTVVDAMGWRARTIKGQEIALEQLGPLQLNAARESKATPINVITHSATRDALPLVAEDKCLFALPLSIRGEPAGLLGFIRAGEAACRGEEALFLQTLAALVSTAICHSRWQREITVLRSANKVIEQIGPRTTSNLPFIHVLRAIARAARELSGSERVVISALGVDGKSRIPLMVYGKRARLMAKESIPFAGLGRWAIEHAEPVFSNDMKADPRVNPDWAAKLLLESGAAAPLWIHGQVVGCLVAYNRERNGHYTERDLGVLAHFAGHAAAAIESASLSNHYRYTPLARTLIWQKLGEKRCSISESSAAEERRRLARELHDGLAQNLSNLNFRLQLIEQKAATVQRDPDALKREIEIVRDVVADMYQDVRLRITALDTPEARRPASDDLVHRLREAVEEFAATSGVPVHLRLPSQSIRLAPVICMRLLQIIQEGCVNVKKHAAATQVVIAVEVREHLLVLRVQDDGRGCRSAHGRSTQGHFGIKMMRERAKEIGAQFALYSQPGRGAEISVSLPIREER